MKLFYPFTHSSHLSITRIYSNGIIKGFSMFYMQKVSARQIEKVTTCCCYVCVFVLLTISRTFTPPIYIDSFVSCFINNIYVVFFLFFWERISTIQPKPLIILFVESRDARDRGIVRVFCGWRSRRIRCTFNGRKAHNRPRLRFIKTSYPLWQTKPLSRVIYYMFSSSIHCWLYYPFRCFCCCCCDSELFCVFGIKSGANSLNFLPVIHSSLSLVHLN